MALFVYVVTFVVKILHPGGQPDPPFDFESVRTDLAHFCIKNKNVKILCKVLPRARFM